MYRLIFLDFRKAFDLIDQNVSLIHNSIYIVFTYVPQLLVAKNQKNIAIRVSGFNTVTFTFALSRDNFSPHVFMVISANLVSTKELVDSSSSDNDFAKSSKSFELHPLNFLSVGSDLSPHQHYFRQKC